MQKEAGELTREVMYRCQPSKPPTPSESGTVSTAADVSIIVAHTMNDALAFFELRTSHDSVSAACLDWTTYQPCAKCSQKAYTKASSVSAQTPHCYIQAPRFLAIACSLVQQVIAYTFLEGFHQRVCISLGAIAPIHVLQTSLSVQ